MNKRDKRSIVLEKDFGSINFYTRRPVDRRKVRIRRLFLDQKYLDHNPERRINIVDRRMLGDRRKVLPEIMNTFWEEAL